MIHGGGVDSRISTKWMRCTREEGLVVVVVCLYCCEYGGKQTGVCMENA